MEHIEPSGATVPSRTSWKDTEVRPTETRVTAVEEATKELVQALDLLLTSDRSSHSLAGTVIGREMAPHVRRAQELLEEKD